VTIQRVDKNTAISEELDITHGGASNSPFYGKFASGAVRGLHHGERESKIPISQHQEPTHERFAVPPSRGLDQQVSKKRPSGGTTN
jgi:hypothetical protein